MSAQVARMRLSGKIEADDQDVQRIALLRRVAVAGAMIAMLIGGLALFDASRKPVEPPPIVSPVPAPAVEPEPPAEETALPTLPPADEATVEAAPVSLEDTPPPLPESTARPEAPPAQSVPASAPSRALSAVPAARAPATIAQTPARATATTPLARVPAPEQGVIEGYRVQVGVFSNVTNAEDVRARLAASGIPSQLEVRVHVGPFGTRTEADQARVQLRRLGLDSAPPAALRSAAPRL